VKHSYYRCEHTWVLMGVHEVNLCIVGNPETELELFADFRVARHPPTTALKLSIIASEPSRYETKLAAKPARRRSCTCVASPHFFPLLCFA